MKALRLLLIDDSVCDAELLMEALQGASRPITATHTSQAEDGLAQLQNEVFDLVLLDLHLPGMDGFELLVQLKADPATRALPVLVLTGSASEQEIQRAYDLQASAVLRKASNFAEFLELTEALGQFWAVPTRLPLLQPVPMH